MTVKSADELLSGWRFDRGEWQTKLSAMPYDELRATFRHHLNYVPNSPVTRLAMIELDRREQS